tara:strand:- start:1445 stop:2161 length:717 start_codon:yes stop_codon:yes gene_type:complete
MQVVLLCGGKGTRLNEKTVKIPKPLIEVGDKPILWHLMKYFEHHGHTDFVLCTGYKADMIKDFVEKREEKTWNITISEGDEDMSKAERILKAKDLLDDTFILSYGDDVTDVNINNVIEQHKNDNKLVTITAVNPECGYGVLELGEKNELAGFKEKPKLPFWVNGGFMVVSKKISEYLHKGELEEEVFEHLVSTKEIGAYKHPGFWKSMNSLKDTLDLNNMVKNNEAIWKVWEANKNEG